MQDVSRSSKKHRLKKALSGISVHTIRFIRPFLFILTLEFLWFSFAFCSDTNSDAVRALDFYSGVSEYLMMSLLLTIACAVIFDISLAQTGKK